MSIPEKEQVISRLQEHLGLAFQKIQGKQIVYMDGKGSNTIILTPESKVHVNGHGWVDITFKQKDILDRSKNSIVALRLQNNKVYYINYFDLKSYLTEESMVNNKKEGDHWKLYIWPDYIEIRGNDKHYYVEPNKIENIKIR